MLKKRLLAVFLVCVLCLLSGTGCRNVKREKELLTQAQGLIEERKYPQAIGLLSEIADNETAAELLDQLYYVISGDYIANLEAGLAAIDREGHVRLAAHPDYFKNLDVDQEETLKAVGEWENIRRLSGANGLDALDKDGGFYTIRGASTSGDDAERNRRIAELEPLRLLSSFQYDFAAQRMDGTLCTYTKDSDYLEQDYVRQQMAGWTEVKDILSGSNMTAVLLGDGTVDFVCAGPFESSYSDMREWTDIVAIDGLGAAAGCIAGLKADGTVVVSNQGVGVNGANFRDALEWTDIIAVSMGFDSLLGLKRDGTVVTAGNLRSGQEKVKEWTDMAAVAAGMQLHVGLKRDGTMVTAGDFGGEPELLDVTDMKDLYVPEITAESSVGK